MGEKKGDGRVIKLKSTSGKALFLEKNINLQKCPGCNNNSTRSHPSRPIQKGKKRKTTLYMQGSKKALNSSLRQVDFLAGKVTTFKACLLNGQGSSQFIL